MTRHDPRRWPREKPEPRPHWALAHPFTGELLDTAATDRLLAGHPDAEVSLGDYRMKLEMLLAAPRRSTT